MPKEFLNRVYHEDTDFLGVVYYANYFRFIERARSEAIREVGISQRKLKTESDLSFVVSKINSQFLKSAIYDDILVTKTSLIHLGAASVILGQKIFREETLIFSSSVTLASINHSGKPIRLPENVRNSLLLI